MSKEKDQESKRKRKIIKLITKNEKRTENKTTEYTERNGGLKMKRREMQKKTKARDKQRKNNE